MYVVTVRTKRIVTVSPELNTYEDCERWIKSDVLAWHDPSTICSYQYSPGCFDIAIVNGPQMLVNIVCLTEPEA